MAEDLWNQNHDETYDTYAAEPARRSGMSTLTLRKARSWVSEVLRARASWVFPTALWACTRRAARSCSRERKYR